MKASVARLALRLSRNSLVFRQRWLQPLLAKRPLEMSVQPHVLSAAKVRSKEARHTGHSMRTKGSRLVSQNGVACGPSSGP